MNLITFLAALIYQTLRSRGLRCGFWLNLNCLGDCFGQSGLVALETERSSILLHILINTPITITPEKQGCIPLMMLSFYDVLGDGTLLMCLHFVTNSCMNEGYALYKTIRHYQNYTDTKHHLNSQILYCVMYLALVLRWHTAGRS